MAIAYEELPDLLLKRECAEFLRLSVRSIEKLIASGDLKAIRWNGCVRIEKGEARAFLERHRFHAQGPAQRHLSRDRSRAQNRSSAPLRSARQVAAELRSRKESA